MDRRKEKRIILNFDEFPLNIEFYGGKDCHFKGKLQNISPSGLCVGFSHSKLLCDVSTKGVLIIIKNKKSITISATLKWILHREDNSYYVGVETDPNELYDIIYSIC